MSKNRDPFQEDEFREEMQRVMAMDNERGTHQARIYLVDEIVKLRRSLRAFSKPIILLTIEGGNLQAVCAKGLPKEAVVVKCDFDCENYDEESLEVANIEGEMALIEQENVEPLDEKANEPILRKYHLV